MYVSMLSQDLNSGWLFAWQGYNLEDATELSLKGDLAVFAANLPTSPPGFAPSYVEMSE